MLKKYQNIIDRSMIILNGILILAVFAIVFWLGDFSPGRDAGMYARTSTAFTFFVCWAMWWKNFSVSERFASLPQVIEKLAVCFFWGLVGYAVFLLFFKPGFGSRMHFLLSVLGSFFLLTLFSTMARMIYQWIRRKSWNYRTVLVVGTRFTAAPLIREIGDHAFFGLRVLGWVGMEQADEGDISGCSCVGQATDMDQVLDRYPADYVLFVIDRKYPPVVEAAVLVCRQRNIEVWVRPDFMSFGLQFSRLSYMGDIPFFNFSFDFMNRVFLKRIFDVAVAIALLAALAVPMAVIGILIRVTSPGPVIFRQKRVGLGGRVFTMYKFRTMCGEEEQRKLADHLVNEMDGPVFKMKNDPRMTPLGRFLRKHSLDELPQLWNVLIGDMSLVGPRPPLASEVALYERWQRFRLSMRPGITCLWQVTARNRVVDFNEWVAMDLKYIDEWSLWLDVRILLKTARVVIKGTGM